MKLRHHFFWMTGVFWLGVGYYALTAAPHRGGATAGVTGNQAPRIARKPGLPTIDAAELARHNQPADCWIAIDGTVFDVTAYVDLHPSKHNEMNHYCGKDGTQPWDIKDAGKDKGKPHTRRSADFLEEYPQMGVLKD